MRISLIMPVYNAEAMLPAALQSMAAQTFHDYEVVFIDDGCTDRTPELLQRFASESGIPCRIIHQNNHGVSAARNRGLKEATGEYFGFVDADDTLEPTALEKAMQAAGDADIIGWDWTLGFEKNGRYMRQADYDTPLQALKNLMGGTMRWNLWLFLIKRDLIVRDNLCFIDGANMGEDMQFMLKAFCAADHVVQIHESLYRYNALSSTSLSRQFSDERRAEITTNLAEATSTILHSAYANELEPYLYHLKLFLKLPLLMGTDRNLYERWFQWFPESNAFATANKALPWRTRMLQKMAANRCWTGVQLYYRLVYQFVYGILYR